MSDYLTGLIGRIGHWGYLVVFLGALLESAAMIGVVVPGEALVLAAGFFAARGVFDLDALIWVVAVGAIVGDSLGYELGRRLSRDALLQHGRRFGITQARLERVDRFFGRHGGASVFFGRFIGFARALVPFLAGASRMPYRRFFAYNAAGAALWAPAIVLLGYFLGSSWHLVETWIGRATGILAGVLLLAWLFGERRRWQHVVPLEVAIVVMWVCLFGAIAEDVVTRDPLTVLDQHLAQWLQVHRWPPLTQVLLVITRLHATLPVSLMTVMLAAWLSWRRDWRWLTTVVLVVPGGMLLNVALKHLFERARPVLDLPILSPTGFSFPSGHVAAATLFYGLLCALVFAHRESLALRATTLTVCLALVALVAFSRIYLGVHYLSDVLGAFAEAAAWLTLCIALIHGRIGRTAIDRLFPSSDGSVSPSR